MAVSEIINGINSDPSTTWAIDYVLELVGKGAYTGDANQLSLISEMTSKLLPLWFATTLLLILGVFGVGLVKTATEKRFLGNWNSFGTPFQIGVCILLLTPLGNGVTFGQTVFIKTIVLGSNIADYTWKEVALAIQSDNTTINSVDKDGKSKATGITEVVAPRFATASGPILCALSAMGKGYAASSGYSEYLTGCGIPKELHALYAANITTGSVAPSVQELAKSTPTLSTLSSTMATLQAAKSPETKAAKQNIEMYCYNYAISEQTCFKEFSPSAPTYKACKTAPKAIQIPTMTGDSIDFDNSKLAKAIFTAVKDSSTCVFNNLIVKDSSYTASGIAGVSPQEMMYKWGWASAAAMGDLVGDPGKAYTAQFETSDIQLSINKDQLPKNDALFIDMDKIKTMDIASRTGGYIDPDVVAAVPGAVMYGSVFSMMAAEMGKPEAKAAKAAAAMGPPNPKFKLLNYMKSLKEIGWVAKAGKGIITATEAVKDIADKAVSALSLIPGLGGAVASVIGSFMKVGGEALKSLSMLFLLLSSFEVLPQAFMTVAVFLWIIRVTVWFNAIPMAVTVVAIPGTRVGHDIWKDMLALALTPLLIILFYIIGSVAIGVLAELSWFSLFRGYCEQPEASGFGCANWGILNIISDLFLGELLVRAFVFGLIVLAGLMMMGGLLLKGPDVVFNIMGLRGVGSQTEILGGDLSNALQTAKGRIAGV